MFRCAFVAVLLASLVHAQLEPTAAAAPQPILPPPTVITGRVVREIDGKPLVGATLRCQRPARRIEFCAAGWTTEIPALFDRAITGPDGRFRLELDGAVGFCRIVLMPTADTDLAELRFPPRSDWVQDAGGWSVAVEVRAPAASRTEGVVRDANGQPVKAAGVTAWFDGIPMDASGQRIAPDVIVPADEHGGFVLPSGSSAMLLEATAPGHAPDDRLLVQAAPGQSLLGLELTLRKAHQLEFEVLEPDGRPCTTASVTASRGQRGVSVTRTGIRGVERETDLLCGGRTDSNGRLSVRPMPETELEIRVNAPGFLPWTRKLVPSDAPLRVVLDAGTTLSGTVRDEHGRPVAGAQVKTLAYISGQVLTDRQGVYRFAGVPPSEAAIVDVTAEGHAIRVVEGVRIEAGRAQTLDIELEPDVRLSGRILDAEGRPFAHKSVMVHGDRLVSSLEEEVWFWRDCEFTHPSWEDHVGLPSLATDENGNFSCDRLYAGSFLVRVGEPAQIFKVRTPCDPVEIRLVPANKLRRRLIGNVFDPETRLPVDDFQVWVQRNTSGGREPDPPERASGRFVVELGEDWVRVVVTCPGRAPWLASFPNGGAWDFERDVPLPLARQLEVRVVDTHGLPVPSATVCVLRDQGGLELFDSNGSSVWGGAHTDDNGACALGALPPERLTLRASLPLAGDKPTSRRGSAIADLRQGGGPGTLEIVLGDDPEG